jgi:hypothetical protein
MTEPDYFTLAELRALPDVSNTSKYSNARCLAVAAYFTSIIEREVGCAFIERTVTDELHDGGSDAIALDKGYVRSVTSATENGVAVTDYLVAPRGGVLIRMSSATSGVPIRWASGTLNVSVTYKHGFSAVAPDDIKEQAMKATRAHLMATASSSSQAERQTSLSTDMGVVGFVVAGPNRPTGYPELDAVINGYKATLDVLGFA